MWALVQHPAEGGGSRCMDCLSVRRSGYSGIFWADSLSFDLSLDLLLQQLLWSLDSSCHSPWIASLIFQRWWEILCSGCFTLVGESEGLGRRGIQRQGRSWGHFTGNSTNEPCTSWKTLGLGKRVSNTFPSFVQGEKRWKELNFTTKSHNFTSITCLYSEFAPSWNESTSWVKKGMEAKGVNTGFFPLFSHRARTSVSSIRAMVELEKQQRWLQNEGDALLTVPKGVLSPVPALQGGFTAGNASVLIHPFVGGVESWHSCRTPRETFLLWYKCEDLWNYLSVLWDSDEPALCFGFFINCFSLVLWATTTLL